MPLAFPRASGVLALARFRSGSATASGAIARSCRGAILRSRLVRFSVPAALASP